MNQVELQRSLLDVSSKLRIANVLTEKVEMELDQFESNQPGLESKSKEVAADLHCQIKGVQDSVDAIIDEVS